MTGETLIVVDEQGLEAARFEGPWSPQRVGLAVSLFSSQCSRAQRVARPDEPADTPLRLVLEESDATREMCSGSVPNAVVQKLIEELSEALRKSDK